MKLPTIPGKHRQWPPSICANPSPASDTLAPSFFTRYDEGGADFRLWASKSERPDGLGSRTKNMSHATRRRTANVPVAAPVAASVTAVAPLARPSGRFDALVDMGNPMKGINLFPYLRRRVEGRALGAMGPAAVLELSRTVREAVLPRRWPREVFRGFLFSFACCCCDHGRSF
jgi:hypothetical protein